MIMTTSSSMMVTALLRNDEARMTNDEGMSKPE
jgi:hypothetical protein